MKRSAMPMVFGIGSPHGDDQAGWLVIEALDENLGAQVSLRKIAVPHQLLDWADPSRETHIIDAALGQVGQWNHLEIEPGEFGQACLPAKPKTNSSHQFGLADTLRLGATLGQLPAKINVWTIGIERAERVTSVAPEVQTTINRVAEEILLYFRHGTYRPER